MFINALFQQVQKNGQIVFISSPAVLFWQGKVSKIISRGPKKEFIVTPVIKSPSNSILIPQKVEIPSQKIVLLDDLQKDDSKKAS